MIAVEAAQVKFAQRVAKRQAKHMRKMAKNSARVKAGKAFPEYADQTRLDYDPYSLPDTTTGKKDSEEKSSDNDQEHEEVTTLGRMATRSQTKAQVTRYYTAAEHIEDGDLEEVLENEVGSDSVRMRSIYMTPLTQRKSMKKQRISLLLI
jgi:hypothetical protein